MAHGAGHAGSPGMGDAGGLGRQGPGSWEEKPEASRSRGDDFRNGARPEPHWGRTRPDWEIGWASFPGRDRMGQDVLIPRDDARIAGGATSRRCRGREDVSKDPQSRKGSQREDSFWKTNNGRSGIAIDALHSSAVPGSLATAAPPWERRSRGADGRGGESGVAVVPPLPPHSEGASRGRSPPLECGAKGVRRPRHRLGNGGAGGRAWEKAVSRSCLPCPRTPKALRAGGRDAHCRRRADWPP